jgi:hypothetical protein
MKVDIKAIDCEDVDWIYLAQDKDQWQPLVSKFD